MDLNVSVKERILLMGMLPQRGGRIEMTLVYGMKAEIEFTSTEISLFELKDDFATGGVKFNPKKVYDKAIIISVEQAKILKDIVIRLDKDGLITTDMLPLLDKIDAL